jgi:hypothetical protein
MTIIDFHELTLAESVLNVSRFMFAYIHIKVRLRARVLAKREGKYVIFLAKRTVNTIGTPFGCFSFPTRCMRI